MNGITAVVDASNVYGSDPVRAEKLRAKPLEKGFLETYEKVLLPKIQFEGQEKEMLAAGDIRW